MIIHLISCALAGIGFGVTFIALLSGGHCLVGKIRAHFKRRRQREDQIITTLNRIEYHLNHPKP